MSRISTNIGNRPVNLSLGLEELGIGDYVRTPIDISRGQVTSGMQKLVDRFVVTLFNQIGSTKHDEEFGTGLIEGMLVGSSMNFGIVQSYVAIAIDQAESQIIAEDESEEYSDDAPDDEKLDSAECESVEYDVKSGTIRMYVSLTSRAGENYTYVLPTNLAFLA